LNFNTFEELKGVLSGGMAGAMMATIAVTVVSIVFPPAAVISTIAALLGFGYGGQAAWSHIKAQQKAQFLNLLKQHLQSSASQMVLYATHHFDDLGSSYERKIGDFFRETVDNHRKRLEEQSEQARQTINRSREENDKLAEYVKHRIIKVENLLRQLKPLLPEKSHT
jgi:hypothetical protein